MNKKRDISFKSMGSLEKKFAIYRQSKVWVPDWGEICNLKDCSNLDVLIMGSYFERIFQLQYWPGGKFNLFCLSPQVRKILINVFEFDSESVGCLSRYDLFPKSKSEETLELGHNTHFYCAGRISPQKNFEFVILTFFYLQTLYSPQIKLSIFGDFDNEYHKDIHGCHFMDYSEKISSLIKALPWQGIPPIIISGLNDEEWLNEIPSKGVFFSASTLLSEDFSVSAAQLQQHGRAMLVPRWGGLYDVRGANVRHYNADLIGNSHERLEMIALKARNFAKNLFDEKYLENLPDCQVSFFPLCQIEQSYLKHIFEKNIKRWGDPIQLLEQMNFPVFASTEVGKRVIFECRKLMSE